MIKFLLKDSVLLLLLVPILVIAYLIINQQTNYFELKEALNFGFWGYFSIKKIENYFIYFNTLIVILNAFLLNFTFNKNNFYEKNSYIIAFLYVMLLSFYQTFYVIDGIIVAQTFFILALHVTFKLDYNADGRKKAFNIGFLVGIATTFFPPAIISIPFLWLMVTRIRPFVFREFILIIVGFIIPIIYASSYNYWYGKKLVIKILHATDQYFQKEIIFLGSIVLFFFLLVFSIIGIRSKLSKSSIKFRKNISILYLFLLFSIVIGLIDWIFYQQYEWFSFLVIPIVIFLPFSYYVMRFNFLSFLFFYIVFLFSVIKFFIY